MTTPDSVADLVVDIDFDQRRKMLKPKTVRSNGHVYTLPVYAPAAVMQGMIALQDAREHPAVAVAGVEAAYESVFGKENLARAFADFSIQDFDALMVGAYGIKVGESKASPTSSRNGGTRPKRTSNGSTNST